MNLLVNLKTVSDDTSGQRMPDGSSIAPNSARHNRGQRLWPPVFSLGMAPGKQRDGAENLTQPCNLTSHTFEQVAKARGNNWAESSMQALHKRERAQAVEILGLKQDVERHKAQADTCKRELAELRLRLREPSVPPAAPAPQPPAAVLAPPPPAAPSKGGSSVGSRPCSATMPRTHAEVVPGSTKGVSEITGGGAAILAPPAPKPPPPAALAPAPPPPAIPRNLEPAASTTTVDGTADGVASIVEAARREAAVERQMRLQTALELERAQSELTRLSARHEARVRTEATVHRELEEKAATSARSAEQLREALRASEEG